MWPLSVVYGRSAEVVACRRPLEQRHRDIVVEETDTLIELGVEGAAFLQQDLVRSAADGGGRLGVGAETSDGLACA